jgi:hypothetical protein
MMSEPLEPSAFIKLDFVRFFPQKIWVSDWGRDATYPDGFRYKILSVRDEKKGVVELVLLLEQDDGSKEEMHRVQLKPVKQVDKYARTFLDGLEEEHGIEFEEQDLSDVRTEEEFERAIAQYGWSSSDPDA